MKKYAAVLICVLFVMLASALRHVILPHAKSAAVEYARRAAYMDAAEVSGVEWSILSNG